MKQAVWLLTALASIAVLSAGALSAQQDPRVAGGQIFVAAPGESPCAAEHVEGRLKQAVSPESVVYFPIENAQRAEDLTGFRAIARFENGERQAGEPRIEYRRMYDAQGVVSLGYRYVVALPLLDIPDAEDYIVSGAVRVARRLTSDQPEVSFSLVLRRGSRLVSSGSAICNAQDLLLEFGGQTGVVTVSFYNAAHFEVDIEGQGAVNVGCSVEPLTDIQARYPDAQLRFLYWRRPPIFNRAGVLHLYADEGEHLYELRADGLQGLPNAYSQADAAFVLTTRRLGGYVISDRPLAWPQEPVAQPNPPTGQSLE
jgi:hypothetical protein